MNTRAKIRSILSGSPEITEEYAERMGYDCGKNGANSTNCAFSIFTTIERTAAWERGRERADRERR